MDYKLISSNSLFNGISEEETKSALNCLQAVTKKYKKNSTIYHTGQNITSTGLLLSGSAYIEQDDLWGNQNIITNVEPGELFSETYSCLSNEPSMVNVIASQDCEVLFLNTSRLISTCTSSCSFHTKLIQNFLSNIAMKNLRLTRKITHMAQKTIRDKILSYLSFYAIKQKSYEFEIPFSRQQLADYLYVDRSALSNELSKMRRDGLIEFRKNIFKLKI